LPGPQLRILQQHVDQGRAVIFRHVLKRGVFPRLGFTACGTLTRRTYCARGSTLRSYRNAWATAQRRSHSRSIATCCQGCKKKRYENWTIGYLGGTMKPSNRMCDFNLCLKWDGDFCWSPHPPPIGRNFRSRVTMSAFSRCTEG